MIDSRAACKQICALSFRQAALKPIEAAYRFHENKAFTFYVKNKVY